MRLRSAWLSLIVAPTRITSYNVCYTKLLRIALDQVQPEPVVPLDQVGGEGGGAAAGQAHVGEPQAVQYPASYNFV